MVNVQFMAAVALASAAFLSGCGREGHDGPERMQKFLSYKVDDILDDIDATPAQRTTANALKDQLFEKGKAFHEGHDETKAALVEQWKSPNPDVAKVSQLNALLDALADDVLDVDEPDRSQTMAAVLAIQEPMRQAEAEMRKLAAQEGDDA